jgi:lysophospholipase L1-like esterase
MQERKLPIWKKIVFALIPALLLLGIIEGVSRIIWAEMEAKAQEQDPNKVINYSRIYDPIVAYKLKPNFDTPEGIFKSQIGRVSFSFAAKTHTNANGFMQRDDVAPEKKPGTLRIITVGESTTQGHHVDENYPSILRKLLAQDANFAGRVEVVNAGVPGWVSDQWALESEHVLAAYKPDVVIFYAGWNDFQSYDPEGVIPEKPWFSTAYSYLPGSSYSLKSVTLLSALWAKFEAKAATADSLRADDHNPDIEGLLKHGTARQIEQAIFSLKAKTERYAQKVAAMEAEADKDNKKIEERKTSIREFEADVQRLSDRLAVVAKDAVELDSHQLYKFFLINLDRAVAAFRQTNPDVKIVVSTLVGRWPYESEAYFLDGNNSIYWMKQHHNDSRQAAHYLERFNDLIRSNAHEKGYTLIDNAAAFADKNREELQWDFAHFTDVGYRMLGENMYHGLVDQGVIH